MRCQVCGTHGGVEGEPCGCCGAPVRSLLGKGIPFGVPDRELREREEERRSRAERLRRRTLNHAVAGAAVFFGLGMVIAAVRLVVIMLAALGGMPVAGALISLLWGLLWTTVGGVIFGAPAGYAINKRNAGPWGGAFLGAAVFAVGASLVNIQAILRSASPGGTLLHCVLIFGAVGLVVGAFIGFHVRADSA